MLYDGRTRSAAGYASGEGKRRRDMIGVFKRSLRFKLGVVLGLVYCVTAAAGLTAFVHMAKGVSQTFAGRLAVKEALFGKNRIAAVLDKELALSKALASDPLIVRWASDPSGEESRERAFGQLEHYRTHFRDASFFIALEKSRDYWVYDTVSGAPGVKASRLDSEAPHDRWFFATMRDVSDYALNLDYNTTLGRAKVFINVIMKDAAGKKLGVAGSGMEIGEFLSAVVKGTDPDVTTYLLDFKGEIQAAPDRALVEANAKALQPFTKHTIFSLFPDAENVQALQAALDKAASGDETPSTLTLNTPTGPALAGLTPLSGLSWANLVLVDASKTAGAGVFLPLSVPAAAALTVVLAAMLFFFGRMVLTPVLSLAGAAKAVGRGEFPDVESKGREDEIGVLQTEFNAMTRRIAQHTHTLESTVAERTAELSTRNDELAESRSRMLEALRSAAAIQTAILPRPGDVEAYFGQVSLFNRPKDLVGGDHIYFRRLSGDRALLGVLDCTGHGPSGAFMTMTVHSLLEHIAGDFSDPGLILVRLDEALRRHFGLDLPGAERLDCGLEIVLCLCEPSGGRVRFAGAGLSLFVGENGSVVEIPGEKRRIGFRGPLNPKPFTVHTISADPGVALFAVTDGVLDESGGEKGYGFGKKKLMELMEETTQPTEFAAALAHALDAWRGDNLRRDDAAAAAFTLKPQTE